MQLAKSLYRLDRQKQSPISAIRSLLKRGHLGRARQLKNMYPDCWRWVMCSEHVEGFLTHAEADRLYQLARDCTPQDQPVVVEIGSWKGKSSIMLAAGLMGKNRPQLFCVDSFQGDEDPGYQEKYYAELMQRDPRDMEEIFKANIRSCGLDHIASPLRGYSFERSRGWKLPIDLLFIDGNHEYRAVLRDFAEWGAFLKVGAVVAFHDCCKEFEGPRRVVQEKIVDPCFTPVQSCDWLAWATKLREGEAQAGN